MPDLTYPPSIADALPDPRAIRARLSDLAAEADVLRALLRLLEQRECGRRLLRRRRAVDRQEMRHAAN
jgi:hypothetical protein